MSALSKSLAFCLLLGFIAAAGLSVPAAAQSTSGDQAVQSEIQRGRIFRETYPLVSETDLYCSIYVQESKLSDVRITTAERSYEKILLSDADIVFINKGKKDGLEIGQVFLVVELGDRIGGYGYLASKRGRASVIFLEDNRAAGARRENLRPDRGRRLPPALRGEGRPCWARTTAIETFSDARRGATGSGTSSIWSAIIARSGRATGAIIDMGEAASIQDRPAVDHLPGHSEGPARSGRRERRRHRYTAENIDIKVPHAATPSRPGSRSRAFSRSREPKLAKLPRQNPRNSRSRYREPQVQGQR